MCINVQYFPASFPSKLFCPILSTWIKTYIWTLHLENIITVQIVNNIRCHLYCSFSYMWMSPWLPEKFSNQLFRKRGSAVFRHKRMVTFTVVPPSADWSRLTFCICQNIDHTREAKFGELTMLVIFPVFPLAYERMKSVPLAWFTRSSVNCFPPHQLFSFISTTFPQEYSTWAIQENLLFLPSKPPAPIHRFLLLLVLAEALSSTAGFPDSPEGWGSPSLLSSSHCPLSMSLFCPHPAPWLWVQIVQNLLQ